MQLLSKVRNDSGGSCECNGDVSPTDCSNLDTAGASCLPFTMACLRIASVILLGALCASTQDSTQACTIEDMYPTDPAVPNSTPVDRILDGDECAIAAAGNSKDPRFIQYLEKINKWDHSQSAAHNEISLEFVQMALAKLGVERDLFEIQCEIQPIATKYVRLHAIEHKLPLYRRLVCHPSSQGNAARQRAK
jgi:hypothetical protein